MARGLPTGDIIIARSELLHTTKKAGVTTLLHPSSFPWLKSLAKVFERYRFVSATLEYRPLVGTTTAGSVTMGVDWMTSTVKLALNENGILTASLKAIDKTGILALTPSVDCPVWQRVPRVVVPSQLLNTRLWYNASAPAADSDVENFVPGYIVSLSTNDTDGEVWIHYKVHFSGTHAAA